MRKRPKIVFVLIMTALAVCCGVLVGGFLGLTRDLPQIRALNDFRPSAVTRVYAGDGSQLAALFVENRSPIPVQDIPPLLTAAIIATEDRQFFEHSGIDVKGILRAAARDIMARQFLEGASTITQQLAKTLFLTSRKTLFRKLQEAMLAFQIERRYTKNEILTLYLNQIYLGSGAYGVASAANIFFGKVLEDLTLAECALIAAMPRAPSRYSPLVNQGLALKRRNIVLKQMMQIDEITPTEYQQAVNEPFHTQKTAGRSSQAPYFVTYIKNQLEDQIGSSLLYKGGLSIYTTISPELQLSAETALANGIQDLEKRMQQRQQDNLHPQGACVALRIGTGEILAMVGGRSHEKSAFNRAVSARRQPGSAFKPIVYAAAVEKMGFSQNMTLLDAPVVFKMGRAGADWKPENFSRTYKGEMTMRKALALSRNIPAVRLLQIAGPDTVIHFARSLGIESSLTPYLSLALGTSEVTLLELTSAYATFPNHGQAITPFGVLEVTDSQGRVIWQAKPRRKVVMSEKSAAIVTDMLQAVVQEGTAKKARVLGRPVAGKTGTTDNYADALFIGFSPDIATGVWVGMDTPRSLGYKETGARAALPVWIAFMRKALETGSNPYFDIPDGMVRKNMDPDTGDILPERTAETVTALFRE